MTRKYQITKDGKPVAVDDRTYNLFVSIMTDDWDKPDARLIIAQTREWWDEDEDQDVPIYYLKELADSFEKRCNEVERLDLRLRWSQHDAIKGNKEVRRLYHELTKANTLLDQAKEIMECFSKTGSYIKLRDNGADWLEDLEKARQKEKI